MLLIVAPNERKVRIEVGRGLEPILTDALSKIIIENAILPRFRAGDFAGGIKDGVHDITLALTGDAAELEQRAKARHDADKPHHRLAGGDLLDASSSCGSSGSCGGTRTQPGAARSPAAAAPYSSLVRVGAAARAAAIGVAGSGGGGFSGGGGSFGGGGASGGW